jgi:nicotinamidase-related amidase
MSLPRLTPTDAVLLQIDWQERLFPAMPADTRDGAVAAAGHLAWLAGELGMPVLRTEQYPRGLGPTLAALPAAPAIEKLDFSACQEPSFAEALRATGRRTVLLTGMEAHICVALTARDLRDAGFDVFVVADAVLSRRPADKELALARMHAEGCVIVPLESALFELAGRAGTPVFKEIARRVK